MITLFTLVFSTVLALTAPAPSVTQPTSSAIGSTASAASRGIPKCPCPIGNKSW